ncbi:MAG: DUF4430 domain-containing protein [Lachnospiraceae bacterium]|nr:DUF4430 domain-containing protein [Lachnospiraceae bacterium]
MKNKMRNSVMRMVLIMALSLALVACGKKAEAPAETTTAETEVADIAEDTSAETTDDAATEEGTLSFILEVVDGDGNTTNFTINTTKATVGEALLDEGLIEGEEGEYGLYVKTVNGVTADYDVDQTYWAFYIDGEYASTGVDQTDVVDGSTYSFKVEK